MTKLNRVSLDYTKYMFTKLYKYMFTKLYKYKYMFKRSVRIHPVLLALVFSQYSPLFLGRTRCTYMYIVQLSLSNKEIGEKLHQKVKFN